MTTQVWGLRLPITTTLKSKHIPHLISTSVLIQSRELEKLSHSDLHICSRAVRFKWLLSTPSMDRLNRSKDNSVQNQANEFRTEHASTKKWRYDLPQVGAFWLLRKGRWEVTGYHLTKSQISHISKHTAQIAWHLIANNMATFHRNHSWPLSRHFSFNTPHIGAMPAIAKRGSCDIWWYSA